MLGISDNAKSINQRYSIREWLVRVLIFITVFIIYLGSAPRTVVLEDDGIFILAAYFNGIAHPPGYPLFTLLGHIATYIPVGSVAFRVHALSACFGAAGCVVLYAIAMFLFNNRILAITTALCLGVSKTYWSQSIIAEVYTLNSLIFLVLLFGAIWYVRHREMTSRKFLFLMFFIYGLGLSNHWPLLVLSIPALLAVLWPRIREVFRTIPYGILFLILGLVPYVWMIIRSQMDPVISFYGPLNSWEEVWYMISRQGYIEVDQSITADYIDKLQFCLFILKETAWQTGPLTGGLALIGFIRQWNCWTTNICVGLVLAYLGNTILLAILLGFDFTPLYQNIFKVYPLIGYSILNLWVALGVHETATYIKHSLQIEASQKTVNNVLCLLTICTALITNIPINYRVNDKLGENYALTILETLDEDAVFFTTSDLDTGPVGYFNLIEKVRPDVTLYNVRSVVFNTRLENPRQLEWESSAETLRDFIESEQRPIYFLYGLPNIYGVNDYGLYRRIDKSLEKGRYNVIENSRIKAFYENLASLDQLFDSWEKMVHKTLFADYCRIEMHLYFLDNPVKHQDKLLKVCRGYYGLISAADVLLAQTQPEIEFISLLLEKAEVLLHEAKDMEDYARYYVIKGSLLAKKGELEEAMIYFNMGIDIWPNEMNPAYQLIQEIRERNKPPID